MSIQSEINRITTAKSAIGTAITDKGVTVPPGTKLDAMAALIASIEAGGGSGGLPEGITALTTGTVIYDITTYAPNVEHDLGAVPNFFFVVAEGATSVSDFDGRMVANFSVKQTLETNAGYYTTLVMSSAGSLTNNTQPIKADSINDYFNDKTIKPYGFFQTGKPYRWYAGILDMTS